VDRKLLILKIDLILNIKFFIYKMLIDRVKELTTDWREIILNWAEENDKLWECMENFYKNEKEKYENMLSIFPAEENIFRCFSYFNSADTKVVIIGQDPYHGAKQATGLCFGVSEDVKKPPSLRNIEKELIKDTGHGLRDVTLESWANQGVLLLNKSLTVVEKAPGTHMKIWQAFTHQMLIHLTENCNNIVFVAWGGFALNSLFGIQPGSGHRGHKIIISSHPSPLSYSRGLKHHHSFKDSQPFIKINNLLENIIDW